MAACQSCPSSSILCVLGEGQQGKMSPRLYEENGKKMEMFGGEKEPRLYDC